jgi:polyisoprenoid-binding protein YceI
MSLDPTRIALAATVAFGARWRADVDRFTINTVGVPTTRGRFAHYRGNLLIDFDRPAKS